MVKFLFHIIVFIALIAGCEEGINTSGTEGNTVERSHSPSSESGVGGSLARFAINGDQLYAVDRRNLNVFDVSNESDPQSVNEVNVGFGVETIFPADSLVYLGTQTGMYVYDITDPENPSYRSNFRHIRSCDPVVVQGNYAYVTLNTRNASCGRDVNELQIVDVSDVDNPQLVKKYDMEGPRGLGIDGDLLFICDYNLKVYDASDVHNLKKINEFNIASKDVIPYRGMLFVIGESGFFQYQYKKDTIQYLSKINVD